MESLSIKIIEKLQKIFQKPMYKRIIMWYNIIKVKEYKQSKSCLGGQEYEK